ncbi:acyl-CoA reductase [Pseudochryseolinea flava]|uniref:Acyl-CoA reductase n=1 Tax=Pseudochryseolinea flava TaxID=2059302 RepID=A0A364Y0G0_9BACT|nr:acyl-CoA reductase [Pseudochryseolinea flava]RAV99574.1 acyl-CoA reductase [Pseudochryseolinea flava]
MKVEDRIAAFASLGTFLSQLSEEQFQTIAEGARLENPWFTKDNVRMAFRGISSMLRHSDLKNWVAQHQLSPSPKTIALVMAGNIPLVGFHDLLAVLISGNHAQLKLSSKDSFLTRFIINKLIEFEPRLHQHIHIAERLQNFDAVIATGSDNSSRYFEQYFGRYQNIIRKNRTSLAIFTGNETEDDFESLGTDIFSYFGLGCRNISKLFVPAGYTFDAFYRSIEIFQDIINHHKYVNNYDYQKSILLVNRVPFFDNGFLIIQENEKTVSPISVIYFEQYQNENDLKNKITNIADKTQCIVGHHALANVPFGQAQYPTLTDYADNIDTLAFLSSLQ